MGLISQSYILGISYYLDMDRLDLSLICKNGPPTRRMPGFLWSKTKCRVCRSLFT